MRELLEHNFRLYIIATGAGAGVQNTLWSIPGASKFFVGASFPYATSDTDAILGFKPQKYCSPETAVDLAMAAFYRAYEYEGHPAIGIGLTASVASEKEHRGEHRIHVAYFTEKECRVHTHTLVKGSGDAVRIYDGNKADSLALAALRESLGIDPPSFTEANPSCFRQELDSSSVARQRFFENPLFRPDGTRGKKEDTPSNVLYPGAFNPPHEGHFGVVSEFHKQYAHYRHKPVVFNITADTRHKDPLTVADMLKRAKLLKGRYRLFTQGDPLYIDKARAWVEPIIFLMGGDAFARVFNPQWCSNKIELAKEFYTLGTEFYVTKRTMGNETFDFDDSDYIFAYPIEGHWDFSSSAIRAKQIGVATASGKDQSGT